MSKSSPSASVPSNTSTTTRIEYPDWVNRNVPALIDQAKNLSQVQNQPQPWPNDTRAGFSPEQLQAFTQIQTLAGTPGNIPGFQEGQQQFAGTLRGDYLHGGSGFNAALDAAQNEIVPRVQSAFNLANRTGGGLAQEAVATGIADEFAKLYGDERTRQLSTLSMAPQMQQLAFDPAMRLGAMGDLTRQRRQEGLNDMMGRYAFSQNVRQDSLDQLINRVNAFTPFSQGGSTIQGRQQQGATSGNPLAGALGGAATGLGAMGTIASLTGGGVPGFAALAPMGAMGAALPFMLGGGLLGGLLS